jgi:hypothetical protein
MPPAHPVPLADRILPADRLPPAGPARSGDPAAWTPASRDQHLGRPRPPRRLTGSGYVVLAAVVGTVLIAGTGWLLLGRTGMASGTAGAGDSASYVPSSTSDGEADPTTTSEVTTTEPTTETTTQPEPDPGVDAERQLQAYRDADLARTGLDGHWVAQLASKVPGLSDPVLVAQNGTHTFYLPDILAEHEQLRRNTALGSVILLQSTDFGRRQLLDGQPIWVTFADNGFASAKAVHRWCAARFPELTGEELKNACTARQLKPLA